MKNIYFVVDLGSTTIDTCLLDKTGCVLGERSLKNRQSLYGSDVINRIMTATRDTSYIRIMKKIVLSDIIEALRDMLTFGNNNYSFEDIDEICISGNTTMISILLEYELESLGRAPFDTILRDSVIISSSKLFDDICAEGLQDCRVYLTGCVSAFIGGDILAGLCYLRSKDALPETVLPMVDRGNFLLLDLGTNGEMVLNNNGKYYATSCACGPAFEGCTRKQKIYGSNTIDAIALALKTKKMSVEGVLQGIYFEKGINIQGVHLDMDILRQILPAKAAIDTGVQYLMKYAGINTCDIDAVYLAGGFGFYLSPDSAIDIGLLPEAFRGKIYTVGNTSLLGACRILLSEETRSEFDAFTSMNIIKVLQLANEPDYQEQLFGNMNFCKK